MRFRVDTETKLRLLLGALLLGLALPAWLLFRQAASQLDLEAFRRQQLIAEETVRRIDATLGAAIAVEEARPFDDYLFATAVSSGPGNVVQRSPLSARSYVSALPGVIGYFAVDAEGRLTTPLLPAAGVDPANYGLNDDERAARRALESRILDVLSENRLVRSESANARQRRERSAGVEPARADSNAPRAQGETEPDRDAGLTSETPVPRAAPARTLRDDASAEAVGRGQAAFDELSTDRVQAQTAPAAPALAAELESEARAVSKATVDAPVSPAVQDAASARVSAFDSELEPLQLSRLDTGQWVLFRNAWRDGERYVQGMLIDPLKFLERATSAPFAAGGFADGTRLMASINAAAPIELARRSAAVAAPAREPRLVYTARLSPPLAQLELAFRVGDLSAGPAYRVLLWTAFVLASVLLVGVYAIYRFGVRQIALTRQHEDFVSAVSHELKTPLTSIRMYGEMLKSGWASEEKKQSYYDYIFAEGERLSRLIDNVLQIARLNRGSVPVVLEQATVGELLDIVRSKVETAVERAGFELALTADPAVRASCLLVDKDAFAQVFINLVDNALKFAHDANRREVVLSARLLQEEVLFGVRDFGPGIAAHDMRRLFELFYRPDDERTRATAGTGIGLALVEQLVAAMHGRVDVRNCDPGAEFRVSFPRAAPAG